MRWPPASCACLLILPVGFAQILTYGRVSGNDDLYSRAASPPLTISWAASGFRARFDSSAIKVDILARPEDDKLVFGPSSVFRFLLDGRVDLQRTSAEQGAISWLVDNLGPGPHELLVIKLTEPKYGIADILNITLAPGGRFLPLTEADVPQRRMQFLGDSYTAGFGILGNSSCRGYTETGNAAVAPIFFESNVNAITEDVTYTYAALVAQQFATDYQVLAWGGATLFPVQVANATLQDIAPPLLPRQQPSIPQLFQQLVAGDDASRGFNLSFWIPQVVVLAGGTNDFHATLPPIENWVAQYIAFINEIQEVYENPLIFVVSFPVEMQTVGVLQPPMAALYVQYNAYLSTVLQELEMDKVHVVQISGTSLPTQNWCAAHPNAAAHKVIAEQLSSYIATVAPEWANRI